VERADYCITCKNSGDYIFEGKCLSDCLPGFYYSKETKEYEGNVY